VLLKTFWLQCGTNKEVTMFINKKSGDDLALAFAKILDQNKSSFQKNASDCASSADDGTASVEGDMAMDLDLESMAKDMLLEGDMAMDLGMEDDMAMDLGMEDDMAMDLAMESDMAMDMEKHAKLMKGLGKIAGSLRRKGESFAADVVEATALSVRNDIVKEAKAKKASQIKKANVLRELDAMASRLSKKGNLKAAKEVIKTARKIVKK
jgi:hypothetical protein